LLNIIELNNPQEIFEQILQQVQLAYHKAELIHGDLSEYNIFVDENNEITLFDWPQWQPLTHPNALWLLKRDLTNVTTFFRRRFRLQYDVETTLARVIAKPNEKKQK
jgi:RIO kinase 2